MNILHLSKFFPPDPGGLESVVAQLAHGAASRGHQVRVISATGSSWIRSPGMRITEPPTKGVVVVRLPTHGVYWSQPFAPGYVAAARWPADVVYVHRPHPLADFAMRRAPKRPSIVFHHADVQRQKALRWLYRPRARAVARDADACVVATESHLHFAEDLGAAGREKTEIIPYGIDVNRFKPGTPSTRPVLFGELGGEPIGLFVGRLVSYKGLDVLLKAVSGSRHRVVVVGGGPGRRQLELDIRRMGLETQVLLAGSPVDAEMRAYYQSADYFILPSTTPAEMFGVVLLEAMACEVPVISTALGTGVEEVNAAEETGIVVRPGDAPALRVAMDRLAEDASLRGRMGKAGRQRVLTRYTVDQMIDAHLELCERVAGKGR